MSWDQSYSVPSVESLLEKLTGKTSVELLLLELNHSGVSVVKQEEILLDEGMYEDVKGTKITLSDGRVFVPKLVERFTSDGNYGLDVYEYALENETPKVKYVNEETSYSSIDASHFPTQYGLTDEADPASDGELENEIKCYCENCECGNDEAME
jgi:hypothetical protein